MAALKFPKKAGDIKKVPWFRRGEGVLSKVDTNERGEVVDSNFMYSRSAKKTCLVLVTDPRLIGEQETLNLP